MFACKLVWGRSHELTAVERTLQLLGDEGLGARPRPELLGAVLTHAGQALRDAVRMGFVHSSRARGRISKALSRVVDCRFVEHSAGPSGSTILTFAVPVFGEVAPELFEQTSLWPMGPEPTENAFDLLAASIRDVLGAVRDSDRFDVNLLRRYAGFKTVLTHGLTAIAMPGPEATEPTTIDAQLTVAAKEMAQQTPPERRVRLMGKLDLLRVSKSVAGLQMEDGSLVTIVYSSGDFLDLRDLLSKDVLIEGQGVFRPNGSLLRVDADAVRKAGAGDSFFATTPRSEILRDYRREAAAVRHGHKPYAAIFGTIPADESDEEYAAAIEALR